MTNHFSGLFCCFHFIEQRWNQNTLGWMCQISWRDRRSRKRASGMTDWTLCRTSLTHSISQRALIMYPLPNLKRYWTNKTPRETRDRESQDVPIFQVLSWTKTTHVPLTIMAKRVKRTWHSSIECEVNRIERESFNASIIADHKERRAFRFMPLNGSS